MIRYLIQIKSHKDNTSLLPIYKQAQIGNLGSMTMGPFVIDKQKKGV